jgi:hypothetical protein
MTDIAAFLRCSNVINPTFICIAPNIYILSIFFWGVRLYSTYRFREETLSFTKWRIPVSIPLDAENWTHRRSFGDAKETSAEPNARLRLASFILRTIFIVSLIVVIARVSMPQSETLWTIFDTPGDVVRLLLGMAACAWVAFQLFTMPSDLHAHRTWLRLGVVAVPFVVICILAIW